MDGEENFRDALGRFKSDQEKKRAEQERERRAAEIELLDNCSSQKEYNERRAAIPHLILEPDSPPDEMTMSDFVKWRDPKRTYGWTHEAYLQAVRDSKK